MAKRPLADCLDRTELLGQPNAAGSDLAVRQISSRTTGPILGIESRRVFGSNVQHTDNWGTVRSTITIDERFGEASLQGLEGFSAHATSVGGHVLPRGRSAISPVPA